MIGDPTELVAREGVHDYAEALRASLKGRPTTNAEHWRELFERGVREAHRQRDLQGLADMAHLAANLLDGLGRLEEALREVEHAIVLVQHDREAHVLLLAVEASILCSDGQVERTRNVLRQVDELSSGLPAGFAGRKAAMYSATSHCMLIDQQTHRAIEESIGLIRAEGTESEWLFLLSWYIPYLYAIGRGRDVHQWERAFRLGADELGHRYRAMDAESFSLGAEALHSVLLEPPAARRGTVRNWLAEWRMALLQLRASLYHGDSAEAGHAFERARRTRSTVTASLDVAEGLEACVRAFVDPAAGEPADPPEELTLLSLGTMLAAAEAVSLCGTSAAAVHWAKRADSLLQRGVRTSMEWPSSLHRIAGVLAARGGDPRKGRRLLQQAVEWCGEHEYVVEQGLAELQLAELCAHAGLARESEWGGMRRDAWKRLRELGVEPAIHAYAVSNALMVARGDTYAPRLAPRETEVLDMLGQGLTYREAAERLGLAYPTVQTLAHRAYEKLGVSGRHKAVQVARELGII